MEYIVNKRETKKQLRNGLKMKTTTFKIGDTVKDRSMVGSETFTIHYISKCGECMLIDSNTDGWRISVNCHDYILV
jgi:hypothetical protein